jgi:hypothetical protein
MNCRDLHLPCTGFEADSVSPAKNSTLSRPELITAGLILLLNAYRSRGCPSLASCIVCHCRTLRAHPDADPVLRQLAAHLEAEWCPLALPGTFATAKQSH